MRPITIFQIIGILPQTRLTDQVIASLSVNSPSFRRQSSSTPLRYAVRYRLYQSAKLLLQLGAKIDNMACNKSSILTIAAATAMISTPAAPNSNPKNDLALLSLLLASAADTNHAGLDTTPLCAAAMSGQEPVAKMLLDWGANPNGTSIEPSMRPSLRGPQWQEGALGGPGTGHDFTAIHLAAGNGYEGIVKLLAERGANLDPRNNRSETPLVLAMRAAHFDVVELLRSLGATPVYRVFIPGADGRCMDIDYVSSPN